MSAAALGTSCRSASHTSPESRSTSAIARPSGLTYLSTLWSMGVPVGRERDGGRCDTSFSPSLRSPARGPQARRPFPVHPTA